MLTRQQCRAGRVLAGWSVADLARQAHVGAATISRFEQGLSAPRHPTLVVLRLALEHAGVRFGDDGAIYPPE